MEAASMIRRTYNKNTVTRFFYSGYVLPWLDHVTLPSIMTIPSVQRYVPRTQP